MSYQDLSNRLSLLENNVKKLRKDIGGVQVTCNKKDVQISNESKSVEVTSNIYCDGGQNSLTEPVAWGCVVNSKGKDLLSPEICKGIINKPTTTLPVGPRNVVVANFNDCVKQREWCRVISDALCIKNSLFSRRCRS